MKALESELAATRGELEALRETQRVRDERYAALMKEADALRAKQSGNSGAQWGAFQRLLVVAAPLWALLVVVLLAAVLFGLVENPGAWVCGACVLLGIGGVVRWVLYGKA
ncbi:MAG TPA: hypothetical protein RMH99_30675 [Sandaracinaceae bacterium LLY-WYZ-13_1]|nr:hypothetical protein [Sandaracinaceae bacterium LLY-WYZ-13_1]